MRDSSDIDALTPRQKRELLARLLGEKAAAPVQPGPVVSDPASRYEPFVLTDVQRAYWLGRGSTLELGNVSCHMYFEFDLQQLDRERLGRIWRSLIDRHDMLRTVIGAEGLQRVLRSVEPYEIEHRDLRAADPAVAAGHLAALRERMSHHVLPSDRWPLFELRTTQLNERQTRVHVSFDLLIVDFRSIQILLKEWFQLYLDPGARLPALEISYRDYMTALARRRDPARARLAEEYWTARLDTMPPAPELPLARSSADVLQPRFARHDAVLEARKWGAIRKAATAAGITPSAVLLGAFTDVLATWSKSPRFTVNVTLFQRVPLHEQVNELVGDFTSITLLEVDRSCRESFEASCRRIQTDLWTDLEHTEYSGVRVLRDLARLRGQSGRAIMPVVFTSALALDTSAVDRTTGLIPVETAFAITQTPQVWLDHQVYEQAGALHFSWDVVEELFPAGMMESVFRAYVDRLESLANDRSVWQNERPCLTPQEHLLLAGAANETTGAVPGGLLHEPFFEVARLHPRRIALFCGDREITFGELARISRHWARVLRAAGAGPNELVAVVMEKGWEQVAAVLAILEAGSAYVPIDADLPAERRAQLLASSEARLVLTQPWLDASLEWPESLVRFSIDPEIAAGDREITEVEAGGTPARRSPDDLAYVIFTSGSTGLPKGVMIDHRGALNTILDVNDRFRVGPGDRVLALSSLSFDLSVWDVFGALAAGAAVVIPEAESKRDPSRWVDLVKRRQVTIWNSVPALLEAATQHAERHQDTLGDSLRLVLLSGDWIPVSLPGRVRRIAPDFKLISLGGATEASIWSILYPVGEVGAAWKSIPYGRAMRNQQMHVWDEAMRTRPVLVPGHLYIGGVGVARGYWRDEERTRQQFVVHPATGERLYRTGDLGRYLPDGNIEFLGREDFQVKVHGFRIELGEIEAALDRHPSVQRAVVTALGPREGPKRLAAYIVGPDAEVEALRDHLSRTLPDYMVPSIWEKLEALPLTANGKVDRAALPSPSALERAGVRSEPASALEGELARIWAAALQIPSVAPEDRFLAIGGDSLVGLQILSDVRGTLQLDVPARLLFENPTLRGFATAVAGLHRGSLPAPSAVAEIVPDPAHGFDPFPLTEIQQAYWIGRGDTLAMGNVAAHVYLEVEGGEIDRERLGRAWQRLVDRHGMLRAVVRSEGRQQILESAPSAEIAYEDCSGEPAADAERRRQAIRDRMSHQVFPTDRWPMFEVRLVRLRGGRHRLHLSFDLLIVDVWSFRLLIVEWFLLYRDPDAALAPLDISFRDYVIGLSSVEQTDAFRRSLDYWRKRIDTLPPGPDLPLACDPRSIARPRFVRRSGALEPDLWGRFKANATIAGLTPSAALMAAFADALATWSATAHFTINVTLFQRLPLHPDINRLVGDFTSVTLLEADCREAEPFAARASRMQAGLWEALDHRYVSGVRVLREMARTQASRGIDRVFMPVVFTSTIGQAMPGLEAPETAGLADLVYMITQTPQVWLDHQVSEQGGGLAFSWDAVEELFPPGVLDGLFAAYVGHLRRLAESAAAWHDAGRPLPPAEQLAQRDQINRSTAAAHDERLLHTGFAEQASIRGEAPAVVQSSRVISYDELSRRAAGVGAVLRAQGAAPNQLVAVLMDKGWEQVAAVLGVLDAGAAYLPIDAAQPVDRIRRLLSNGEVRSVLTQSKRLEEWRADGTVWPEELRFTAVDALTPAAAPLDPAATRQQPDDLAYVIYTSGSTGDPKGVMIDHRAAVNTIVDVNRRFHVSSEDRVLALSSLGFDLSVYDIFGLLAAGGTIVMPDRGAGMDPRHWVDACRAHGVTIWNSVPALMQLAVADVARRGEQWPHSLRLVLLSGDWIPVGLPDRIRAVAGTAQVVGLGGATEASIWSIVFPIGQVDPGWPSIPYGVPMANQRWHILDSSLDHRPVWVPGELYIAGTGLARGYWRDEGRTAEKFLTHPRSGERMYRTGDLGRYLPDGNIEFLGRQDLQVKVHGHRIELGEIEAALEQHPGVESAAVVPLGSAIERTGLAGYVTVSRTNRSLLYEEADRSHPEDQEAWERTKRGAHTRATSVADVLLDRHGLFPLLERLALAYMRQALSRLGVDLDRAGSADELLRAGRIHPRYAAVVAQWLDVLPRGDAADSIEDLWPPLRLAAGSDDVGRLLDYVRDSGESLPALLRGEQDPLDLLFAGGRSDIAESLYQLNPAARYSNEIVRDALAARLGGDTSQALLRVLDVGAGIGATTAALLPVLRGRNVFYHYTDVSPFFLNAARRKFTEYDFLEYSLLDVDEPAADQGYQPASYDVIVAANVLHNARDLAGSLQQLRSLLKPAGQLMMLEGTRNIPVQMITVGLLEGLSRAEDERDERGLPFLPVETWRASLSAAGFTEVAAYPEDQVAAVFVHAIFGLNSPIAARFREEELARFLRTRLPDYMVPSRFTALEAFPLSANGKVNRKALGATTRREARLTAYAPPRNSLEERLAALWAEVLRVERVGIHDNFFDLGGDSLLAIQLLSRARDAGIAAEPRMLFERQTIALLAPLLADPQSWAAAAAATPLAVLQSTGEATPVFCVHPSTGTVECYLELARAMSPDHPIYGLEWQPPGEGSGTTIEGLAERYIQAMKTACPSGPYALVGWSSGGVIAFEMARRLVAGGADVALLALLDIDLEGYREVVYDSDESFIQSMAAASGVLVSGSESLTMGEGLDAALERMPSFAGLLAADSPLAPEKYFEIVRTNIRAMQEYVPAAYPRSLTLFRAADRPSSRERPHDLGWGDIAQGGVDVHVVPGGHFDVLRPTNAARIAGVLRGALNAQTV